jgi:hypothetical protein
VFSTLGNFELSRSVRSIYKHKNVLSSFISSPFVLGLLAPIGPLEAQLAYILFLSGPSDPLQSYYLNLILFFGYLFDHVT